ncbi:lipid-A-disaccharide synthase [uncultured Victivallis sp.]|uniref:lipid-A-disaccharide synthase n=1 Tax=uncultured Victivallis sp. TaxID=354118 RepID=UPI0025F63202|nr:lipid-A-disaccharide synthase [uncultured Victivallis sp.]
MAEKKIWILAGEASGDLYGARLARELRAIAAERGDTVRISGMGGPQMAAADIDLKVDSTELGVVGVIEVLKHIFTFVAIFFRLVRAAKQERPDEVVLIDYPGFNLLFALMMYLNRIPVVWYVCPHLWVWGKWRLPVLAKICTKMLVIFPFEEEVFAPTRLRATFVGHPLVDIVEERRNPEIERSPEEFLLLPGSRTMEINFLLRPMLDTISRLAERHPELKFHLSAPREKIARLCDEIYHEYRCKHPDAPAVTISCADTPYWQQRAGTGLAASGTVTVESAIAGLPLVVGYKLNWVTILLASLVVRLYRGYFTMVNIIANRTIYEEFLQHHFSPKELVPAVERILPGGERRAEVEAGMEEVRKLLKPKSSSAARQAALACYDL